MSKLEINAVGIIPARYASKRLPGKPLVDIAGKSLLQRVYETVGTSKFLSEVIIATDDSRIKDECSRIGAKSVMTSNDLKSGTDRISEANRNLNFKHDIIVNIQGDEPFLEGSLIDELLLKFVKTDADVGTLITRIKSEKELFDPSNVKVVLDNKDFAVYFSRSPVPHLRGIKNLNWVDNFYFWKHIGIYAYKKESLFRFSSLPQSNLEKAEKLEQLRLLQDGAKYFCLKTDVEHIGIDTKDDIHEAVKIIETRQDS